LPERTQLQLFVFNNLVVSFHQINFLLIRRFALRPGGAYIASCAMYAIRQSKNICQQYIN
jgi:hypothetical protein